MSVDIHAKVLSRVAPQAVPAVAHSLEHRIALLKARFDAIDRRIAEAAAAAPKAAASAPVQAKGPNPEWEPIEKDTPVVARLRGVAKELQLHSAKFQWVPSNYYKEKLAWRRDELKAPSTQFLCKAIVLENTHCVNSDCSDRNNSRYYVAVFQYVQRFDAELVMRFVKGLNEGIGKKKFNFRLAANGEEVTGFEHNAVVPFGLKTEMPIILCSRITELKPAFFWMGGGHEDCKLRLDTEEFIERFNPFIADITVPYSEEELATL